LANLISGHSTIEHFFTVNQNTATYHTKILQLLQDPMVAVILRLVTKHMLCGFTCPIFQISSENH